MRNFAFKRQNKAKNPIASILIQKSFDQTVLLFGFCGIRECYQLQPAAGAFNIFNAGCIQPHLCDYQSKMLSVGPGGRSLSRNGTCELPEATDNLLFVHVRSYDL